MRTLCCVAVLVLTAWSPVKVAQERIGAFMVDQARDEASGEMRRSMTVQPLAASASSTRGVALIWICANDNLRVLYTFDIPLRGDDSGAVEVRFRADPAQPFVEQDWWVSSGGRRAVMPVGDDEPLNALARTMGSIVIEVRDPADDRRMSHRFDLKGFDEALGQLPCA